MNYTIYQRREVEVNTDPQRRCYNGAHFSSEWLWTPWEVLEHFENAEKLPMGPEERLRFWRDLNKIAVRGRGRRAHCEFKVEVQQ